MIQLGNRKIRRLLIIGIGIFILFTTLLYIVAAKPIDKSYTEHLENGYRVFSENFDFSYLKNMPPVSGDEPSTIDEKNADTTKSLSSKFNGDFLNEKGFKILPQNVDFKYINPKNKQGDKEEILKQHSESYEKILKTEVREPKDFDIESIRPPAEGVAYEHANATIVALVRNHEFGPIGNTIKKLEKQFNSKFKYPYTLINDVPFTDKFKERIRRFTDAPIEFVTIPSNLWDKPESIDIVKEAKAMSVMTANNVAYAAMGSYHNMCRFYSGNLFNLPEMQKYKFYWRIEPHVEFYSNINYDVFKYLEGTKKVYGFTISLYDIAETIQTLWPETLKFLNMGDNYKYINPNGSFQWLLNNLQNPQNNNKTGGFSTCHFWTNFEIVDMDFLRSEAYTKWFKHLDSTGNFYYERWGDAPVRSMGLGLFADKNQVHWFRDIGYFHDPYFHCPSTPFTAGCEIGKFSKWPHLEDQNCMMSWIDYSIDNLDAIY
ncbi:glycolipid 2-alpha-mannosyltransferase [Scheffersomyces amazonensis]|uniref:glycolipid 2-alpha-mannosyltransferase n=1 Tax=Scheffersomyces amazonensis TaxID=1078765 RepID=UPI00315D015D